MGTRFDVSVFVALTEDPVKGPRTIAHLVRLQGFALVSYRLQTPYDWHGNMPLRV